MRPRRIDKNRGKRVNHIASIRVKQAVTQTSNFFTLMILFKRSECSDYHFREATPGRYYNVQKARRDGSVRKDGSGGSVWSRDVTSTRASKTSDLAGAP
jgi:hypothetical protein